MQYYDSIKDCILQGLQKISCDFSFGSFENRILSVRTQQARNVKEKAQTFLPALMFWGDSGKNLIFYSPVKQHDNILANKTYLSYYDG